jgi:hypothetical protein
MKLWAMRRFVTLVASALSIIGCTNRTPTARTDRPSAGVAPPINALPPAKTAVTFQEKYTKVIPLENSAKPAYQVVQQWVFEMNDKGDNLICIGDGEHCITLAKLNEQLHGQPTASSGPKTGDSR